MFSIYDGRKEFYQWDKDRKIIVEDSTIKQVHFCNKTDDCSLVVDTYTEDGVTLANVPNILLQTDWKIRVYGYTGDYTKHEECFKVVGRSKPADYIYTEAEFWTVEKAVEEALEAAKESGDFKGEKGDKGEPGAVKMVVVTELPATGETDAIYLLPKADGAENNSFDEYVFTNGAWECIGSAGVEVNLDEYVKKTDYATQATAGLVRVYNGGYHGLKVNNDGLLTVYNTTDGEIDSRKQHRAITASGLDYAIKSGLTTNKLEWTDEEKQAARELVGAIGDADYANYQKAGLVKPSSWHGIVIDDKGTLSLVNTTAAHIDKKGEGAQRVPITTSTLDYAVKVGMTTNTEEWTEEEKQAARQLIGADLATTTAPGIVRTMSEYGVQLVSPSMGVLGIKCANKENINAKATSYLPIAPKQLDYAVKVGMTTNTEEWTEEEQTAARNVIGAIGANDYATAIEPGVIKVGEGVFLAGNGKLCVMAAKEEEVKAKANTFRPIVPYNLNLAVKCGITDNSITLTDEEKQAALEWLGVNSLIADLTARIEALGG